MTRGLQFEDQASVVRSALNRADIACFVGFVARREDQAIPGQLRRWLEEQGWGAPPYRRADVPWFRSNDLLNANGLAGKLADTATLAKSLNAKLAGFLCTVADEEAPLLLNEAAAASRPPAVVRRGLLVVLNGLLTDPDLHDPALYQSIELPDGVKALLDLHLRGDDLLRANRRLLEALFPAELGPGRGDALEMLLDLPVPIESWEVFDQLFAWDLRDLNGRGAVGTTYLGAAVRSYFAQGGRKCYVVRVGDPWLYTASRTRRLRRIERLLPGYPADFSASPVDRAGWHGFAHLFGLPDVSFVCMPDLAEMVAADPEPLTLQESLVTPAEQFAEWSEPGPPQAEDRAARWVRAPRCDRYGYQKWAEALRVAADVLARRQREVQLVAAVPIPLAGTPAQRSLLGYLGSDEHGPLAISLGSGGLASAFVQLVYPWVRTPGSRDLPERIESPEGVLAGLLARSILLRGSFRSAAGSHLADVVELVPELSAEQIRMAYADQRGQPKAAHTLAERVSLFGPTTSGLTLLSDVTTSFDESYRPASVNRLVAAIVRSARRLGEQVVFEPSSERLWARVRESMNDLLTGLLREGALRGIRPAEAFRVRCDRSTMSQNDMDNGRVIAEVMFEAALPIETITVVLALGEGGATSVGQRQVGG